MTKNKNQSTGTNILGLAIVVLALSVGFALTSYSVISGPPSTVSSGTSQSNGATQRAVYPFPPVTLHSVAYAEKAVNSSLVVPNFVSAAANASTPRLAGLTVDSTSPTWMVTLYYSSSSFQNGTTDAAILASGAFSIVESPASGNVTTQSFLNQQAPNAVSCNWDSMNSCAAMQSTSLPHYTVSQNGAVIIVNPFTPDLLWVDTQHHLYLNIIGGAGASVTQLLNLSNVVT